MVWIPDSDRRIVNSQTDANTTHWLLRREDSSYVVDGQVYIFQVRCGYGCGYGRNNTIVGKFPGTYLFTFFFSYSLDQILLETCSTFVQHGVAQALTCEDPFIHS